MKQFVDKYLKDHETAWSPSTLKSERSRLKTNGHLLDKKPETAFRAMQANGAKPYAIKTTFIRFCQLEAWCMERGLVKEATFKQFMDKHRNRFKHAYVKEDVTITYQEAKAKIETLEEPYRSQALGMLKNGVRISEAGKIKDGKVMGKGGKVRTVFADINETAPTVTFWRKLKAIGLKPHTLRKLCATRVASTGATPADLCKVFGWSSIQTAYNYLQSQQEAELKVLVEKAAKD